MKFVKRAITYALIPPMLVEFSLGFKWTPFNDFADWLDKNGWWEPN